MITKKLLREWEACWSDEKIAELAGRKKAMTPRAIATDERIPVDDRAWVLCRALYHLNPSGARLFAYECALSCVHHAGEFEDELRGILNDLLQAEDLSEEQRSAAESVAWSAARSAAWSAARSAARSAAESAAWSAAESAAGSAARSAAWSAARSAAESAARSAAESVAWSAARSAAWSAAWEDTVKRALEWLGDYADGWEE